MIGFPVIELFGIYSFGVFDQKYSEMPVYTLSDIILLKNIFFVTTEKDYPSFTSSPPPYEKTDSGRLYQYGHIYSRRFSALTAIHDEEHYVTKLLSESLSRIENEPSTALMQLQAAMLFASLGAEHNPPIVTVKTNKKGVTPYEL